MNTLRQESFVRNHSGRVLLALVAGGLLIYLGRGLLPPLLPTITDELAITSSRAGAALSLLWFAYAIVHFPGGRLSDSLSRITIITASIALTVAGFIVLSFATTYERLLIAVLLVGVGHGLYMPSSRALVADIFIRRRAQAIGLQIAGTSLGNALAAGLAIVAIAVTVWQNAFVPTIIGLIVVTVALHRWSEESYVITNVEIDALQTLQRLLSVRQIVLITITYSLFSFAWMGIISFLPTFIHVEQGFSITIGSIGYALFYLSGTLMSPVAGRIADWQSEFLLLIGMIGMTMTGLVLFIVTGSITGILIGSCLLGAGFYGYPPVMQSVMLHIFPNDSLAGDYGAIKTIYTAFGAIGPMYVGYIAEQMSYTKAFTSFLLLLLIIAVILLILYRNNTNGL